MGYVDPERARAYERDKYWRRRNDGMCVRCGKRYADAGHCMCRSCGMAAKDLKRRIDPEGANHLAWLNKRNQDRKMLGICIDCGCKLTDTRFSRCKSCTKRRAEYQQVRRIRERIRGGK